MCRCIVRSDRIEGSVLRLPAYRHGGCYGTQRFNYRDFMNNYVIVSP